MSLRTISLRSRPDWEPPGATTSSHAMDPDALRHLQALEHIVREANFSPAFRHHPRYPVTGLARIAYDDVMHWRWLIRDDPECSDRRWWNGEGRVVARYDSAMALIADGWRLD